MTTMTATTRPMTFPFERAMGRGMGRQLIKLAVYP